MKKTIVISAFPGCGKSTYFNQHKNSNKIILDSDSSLFSWIYDEGGNKTEVRNPDFPENYINHIKENLGTADIIFVSSHAQVRKAMADNSIDYINIFPAIDMKEYWIKRLKNRGDNEKFIDLIDCSWNIFIDSMASDKHAYAIMQISKPDIAINDEIIHNCQKIYQGHVWTSLQVQWVIR